jgi:predicted NBD/HSP70 family sugar kinase
MTRVIGIDVGGTKVAASTLTREHVGDTIEWRTEHKSADLLTDQLVNLVNRAAVGRPYCGVGIGVPSVVRFQTGEAVSSINIPLTSDEFGGLCTPGRRLWIDREPVLGEVAG